MRRRSRGLSAVNLVIGPVLLKTGGMDEAALVDRLAALIGPAHVLTGEAAAPWCTGWRGLFHGCALAVVRPGSTAELAACVAACAQAGQAMVPQGGNTGLCGGATPRDGDLVIALGRLNRIRDLDAASLTLTAEAGCTLQAANSQAASAGLALPIGLASGGTAQLGGAISTNAGGTATLRYGNTRDLVLGLEVVLPDGRIWHGLRALRKDNTGYALRHLFAGAEGTLGIITAACLRLVPAPACTETAFVALPSPEAALDLLGALRRADEPALHAFEYLSGAALRMVVAEMPGCGDPFAAPAPDYALIDFAGPRDRLEAVLADALARDVASDAVIATSEARKAALWRLRDNQAEAQARAGPNIKNDIAVPLATIPAFLRQASRACRAILPDLRVVPFGHLGDGNIHFNLVAAPGAQATFFKAHADALMHAVGEVARQLGGSFSAEHGIGQLKTAMLGEWRGGVEIELMQRIKQALDPAGLLNPGKVLARPTRA